MRPEVQTSLDSDLVLNRLFRFRYLNTCLLTLVRGNGSDRLDRFLCPTSNPGRSRCLLVSPSNCIKRVWWVGEFLRREIDGLRLVRLSSCEEGRERRAARGRSGAKRSGARRAERSGAERRRDAIDARELTLT